MLQTEHEFTLPMGYVDGEGDMHKEGVMRLATAADEILPMKDPRVQKNPAYLVVILLSRVVSKLGTLEAITPKVIEGLFAKDLEYLQNLYNEINQVSPHNRSISCPQCSHVFEEEPVSAGGS
ncbi:MAG TPA: phage tail assembly protein [Verrucomicrobiae bacterium]|nr:phage tail assembly protein [Verrucomicrobiae bacterium]